MDELERSDMAQEPMRVQTIMPPASESELLGDTPVTYETSNPQRSTTPSQKTIPPIPTSALVCGILSIVLFNMIIPGIVLGIIAVVTANKYIKAGGQDMSPKYGRTCGIIGIALSIAVLLFYIVAMIWIFSPSPSYSTSSSVYQHDFPNDVTEQTIIESIDPYMERLNPNDEEMVEAAAFEIELSFEKLMKQNGLQFNLEDCGLNAEALAKAELGQTQIGTANVHKRGSKVFIDYSVTRRNSRYVTSEFESKLDNIIPDYRKGALTSDEATALIGEALLAAYDETHISNEILTVEVTQEGNDWVIESSEMGHIADYLFFLSTEKDNHTSDIDWW